MSKKIFIIGSGGREHAIGAKIKQDNPDTELIFCPGNGGTDALGLSVNLTSVDEMLDFALENQMDLTIVGPEAPLVEGIVDAFQTKNLLIFGANQQAAQLEGSKVFAKNFMQKYGVRTATSQQFKHYVDAKKYVEELQQFPVVVKVSGLAAGKGVIICYDSFEAEEAVRNIMLDHQFGEAGNEIVIEEFLEGFECSILSFYNGKEIIPMLSAKDHKKIGEGETGLNTGGMGVIAPNPLFMEAHYQTFVNDILNPTLAGLQAEKMDFAGIIFFGLMINAQGVYLLEYNMRFGDPETQTILPLLESNLLTVFEKCIAHESIDLQWKKQYACIVVIASGGYPAQYDTGFEIFGLNNVTCPYYVAGATLHDGQMLTSGGRVLNIVGLGNTLDEAKKQAYENVKKVRFDYQYYRKDIGDL